MKMMSIDTQGHLYTPVYSVVFFVFNTSQKFPPIHTAIPEIMDNTLTSEKAGALRQQKEYFGFISSSFLVK